MPAGTYAITVSNGAGVVSVASNFLVSSTK
jgi:hypothetical protein